jgi:selenide,water dikinase
MLLASDNVSAEIRAGSVPLLEGALECVRAGYIPGGLTANRDFAECVVNYEGGLPEELKTMLFDPQTAGGLLIAVDGKQSAALKSALLSAGVPSADIGKIVPKRGSLITVTQ